MYADKLMRSRNRIRANVRKGDTRPMKMISKMQGLLVCRTLRFQTYSFKASMMKYQIIDRARLPK